MLERDLILGVLATQARFATPAQIMEAASARLIDKGGPSLLARLEISGTITVEQRALLEAMADAALKASDGKPGQVLASLGGPRVVSITFGGAEAPLPTLPASDSDAEGRIPPEREGQYARLGEIGRGGQSVVLRALDRFIGREVAIKELLPGSTEKLTPSASPIGARFLREVRLTAQLDHPGIVPVHELAQRPDGTLFCAEKLIRGETLKVRLARCTALSQRLGLLPHLIDACHAIAYAHSRGVIHRDLKPSNIMVGPYGETVVVDWGLAKRRGEVEERPSAPSLGAHLDPGLTVAGVALGTPSYMSPEQARGAIGEIAERSDVFSLGAILYELLCGRVPFEGATNEQIIEKVLTAPVLPVRTVCPEVSPELAAIADRALQRAPADRYQTADALVKDLLAYRSGERVKAYEYGSWELIRKFVGRHQGLGIASAVALLILAASGLNTWRQLRQSRRDLASSLLERAHDAERESDWGRAAGYHAESRIEQDSREARWGYALARQKMPHRLFARRRADQSVIDVGYLRDGRAVALAVEAPFVVGRELESGRELWRFEYTPSSGFPAIQPTGEVRLGNGLDRTYLDAATGKPLATFGVGDASPCPSSPFPPPVLFKAEGLVTSGPGPVLLAPRLDPRSPCVVSADDQRAAFRDAAGIVHLWDLHERRELASRDAPDASDLLFTAHGLAVVRANAIQVLGGTEGDFVVAIPGRGGNGLMRVPGRGNAVSPDGHLLVTNRLTSNQADVVDLRTRTIVASFSYPPGAPQFTFSPASDQLLVAGLLHGSVVAGWDLRSQAPAHRVTGSPLMAFQSAQDGTRFEVLHYSFYGSRYEVWNEAGEKLHSGELGGARANATISGDGQRVAVTDPGGVEVRDALTGETFFHVACEQCLRIRLSHDGAYLLVWSAKGRLELWDVAQRKSVWSESGRVGSSTDPVDLSGDGKWVLWTRGLELFLVGVGSGIEARLRLDEVIQGAHFSRDSTRLAVVTPATIGVWAVDGPRPLWRVGNFSSVNQEVNWSGDDSALIILYDSLGTQLLDSATGERFANLPVTKPGAFGTQEVVLPSLRYRISRGDGVWEMWPLPAPDDGPPRESLQRVLSEAGLELRGVELVDAAPASPAVVTTPASSK